MGEWAIKDFLKIWNRVHNNSVLITLTTFFVIVILIFLYGSLKSNDSSLSFYFFIGLIVSVILYVLILIFFVKKCPDFEKTEQQRIIENSVKTLLNDPTIKKATIKCDRDSTKIDIVRGQQKTKKKSDNS